MKQYLALMLAATICLSLAACGKRSEPSQSSTPSSTGAAYRVAAIFAQEDAYSAQMLAGAQTAIEQSGADITLDISYSENSKVAERTALNALDPKKTPGVLCAPVSSDESVAELNRLRERGFKIAIAGVSSQSTEFASVALAYNPYELGSAAGEAARGYIEGSLSGKAGVAVMHHNTADLVESTLRQNGFLDALKDLKEVSVVGALDLSSDEKPEERIAAFLKDHQDIDVIFCTTGQELTSVHRAVVAAEYKAALYGVDAYQDVIDILRSPENTIQAVAAQNYYDMGYAAMVALINEFDPLLKSMEAPALTPVMLTPGDEAALSNFETRLN